MASYLLMRLFLFRYFTKENGLGFETVWTEISQIMGPSWFSVPQVSKPGVAPLLMQRLRADGGINLEQNLTQGL